MNGRTSRCLKGAMWTVDGSADVFIMYVSCICPRKADGQGGKELTEIINEAMAKFTVSNPLHPDVFPGIRKMEAEIVSICLNLFNGPNGAGTSK